MIREDEDIDDIQKYKKQRTQQTSIKLENETLTIIPPDMYNNTHLESLTITKNKFAIILPREFSRLSSSLKTLSFADSKISNLHLIFLLTNLEHLDLKNVTMNVVPNEIGNLTHLKHLNLSFTGISGLPNSFINLQNLEELALNDNNFDTIPEVICGIKKIRALLIANNQISIIPDYLKELTRLDFLELENNKIQTIPEIFGNLKSLEYVNLSHNNLRELSDTFGKLENIGMIEAMSNAIKYISPSLTKLEKLTELNLDNNLISDMPNFDLDKIKISLDENPMSSYKNFNIPNHIDTTFDEFNALMEKFKDKDQTIINNTNGYINDAILHGQTNPYVVHYETYNGLSYPIITILKGTLLFTARKNISSTVAESFFHLYKLYDNQTLEKYKENDFENVLTYFFPVPFMAPIVESDYKTMDIVVLSKDIRLLCLLSPSPIERGDKVFNGTLVNNDNVPYYKENVIHECPTRDYDLCMSTDLIFGLKLNGYIGIAYSDSPSHPANAKIMKEIAGNIDYKKSLLYLSSCFNNAIYKKPTDVSGNDFIERMMSSRTHGIPEVVLIPYDIHTNNNNTPEKYAKIYAKHMEYVSEKANKIPKKFFIFDYVLNVDGSDTFDVADYMGTVLDDMKNNSEISKSLQCYPLFTVLNSHIDPSKRNMLLLDDRPVTLNDVSFPNSYTNQPTSYCAFENAKFYEMLEENTHLVGGRNVLSSIEPHLNKLNINSKQKQQYLTLAKINQTKNKNIPQQKYNKYVSERVYYNEVSDIPIFAFKKVKNGGKQYKPNSKKTTKKTNKKLNKKKKATKKNKK